MPFENSRPYIVEPLEKFKNFSFVSWEKEIYPKFKNGLKKDEIDFFAKIITENNFRSIVDFGVGSGSDLSAILDALKRKNHMLESTEANEVHDEFIRRSSELFKRKKQNVLVHKANWVDLPEAMPKYAKKFDFGFLTGNSLTYIGGASREYTKKAQQSIVNKFAKLIKKDGCIFIDSRNCDYVKSLSKLPKEKILKKFSFDQTVYYHGKIIALPVYISDSIIVFHYYDEQNKKWSEIADLYPLYQKDIADILSENFIIEKTYHDFGRIKKKSQFVQYLARKA